MPSPHLNHVPKHHVYTFPKHLQGISLKLQLPPRCQDLTLLYEVSLPKKSTDSMLNTNATYHSNYPCFLNYLYESAAIERGFVLAEQNQVLLLINKTNGFIELVISGILTLYVLHLYGGRKRSGESPRDLREFSCFSVPEK